MRTPLLGLAIILIPSLIYAQSNTKSIAMIASKRSVGVEYSDSFFLHYGAALYKLYPGNSNTVGARIDIGYGFAAGNISFVIVDEPKSNPQSVGLAAGLRAAGGFPIGNNMLIGAYALALRGDTKNSNEIGIQFAYIFDRKGFPRY
jgi:hypothetical protein